MDFEGMIAKGENPAGFTAQTVNGTAHAMGTGYNQQFEYTMPEVPVKAVWPAGRSNRTGE